MTRCQAVLTRFCMILLAVVPAYCQRGTIGIDIGQTSDKFDSLSSESGLVFGVDGQIVVLQANEKSGRPALTVGGEIRDPTDTGNHAREYAFFGGPEFHPRNFTIGLHVQLRQIDLPPSTVDNQVFARDRMRLLEIPLVIKYNFGKSKGAFIQAEGAPEFTPHFKRPSSSLVSLPNPNLDHGYFMRGTVGYVFPKNWYVKVAYENRYFKFVENAGNPSNLYNWRTNLISGGIGFAF